MERHLQGSVANIDRRAVLALGLVVLGGTLTRGDGREDLTPRRVHLEMRLLVTGTGSATFPSGGRVGDLAAGESQVWSLVVGLDRDQQGNVAGCRYNVNVPAFPVRDVPEEASHVWEARLTVRAASLEKIDLDVDWKRYVRGADGKPRAVAGDSRAVAFGEDQRLLLDFVGMRQVPDWESCYESLALELEAKVAEDPALADRRIAYDLWLVDEGPGGPSATRRWQMAGKQGEAREFDFEPLHRSVPGEATPVRVDTRVSGKVRGRVRDDGSLEMALLAKRFDNPEHRHWALSGSGEKRVRVSAGETIRLELPAPAPDVSHEPDGSELKRDVDRGILASLRERTVSLVLTARPVE
jgi:hypothetical protein